MHYIDWMIVIIPVAIILWLAWYAKRYARGIVDFLAAGRVAGRYVISVGDLTSALSVVTLVAGVEMQYQTGYAVTFWNSIVITMGIFISLSGFFIYRWRCTECLSLGQFLELRYGSKFFRVFCATIKTLAEMIANAIGPAIAANFFIYYLGLPHKIMIFGVSLPCYGIVVFMCLVLAILIIWPAGRISLLLTDCIQGLLSYPIFMIIVGYIILNFSWGNDIVPVMTNRVAGQSFFNPYDISELRDFNLFSVIVILISSIFNRGVWIGNDSSGSARTPHEQKMSGVLGSWRAGFSAIMIILIAILSITFLNSPNFSTKNNKFGVDNNLVRQKLSHKILEEVVPDETARNNAIAEVVNIPSSNEMPTKIVDGKLFWEEPLSQQKNLDTVYYDAIGKGLGDTPVAREQYQKYKSLHQQMLMPVVLREIFPIGLTGLFCLLMVMLLISTDDSRIFNASSTLMQDIVLPMFKKRLDKKTHLLLLRMTTLFVAMVYFVVSMLFSQMDYITMFTAIMFSVWVSAAGSIMTFGLYSRFGNLTGAWCAVIFGSGNSILGLIFQRNWAKHIYPFLENHGWVDNIDHFLRTVSSPFNPWVQWSMSSTKYPINSYEIVFISMVLAISSYIIGSLITYKPYNLDKLLHRGEYAKEGAIAPTKWSFRTLVTKLIGITPEYTKGDRIIAYVVFCYSFIYGFVLIFCGIIIWNMISPWTLEYWSIKFFITSIVVPSIVGVASTIWFLWGGIRDGRQLFIDLGKRVEDDDDNGQII